MSMKKIKYLNQIFIENIDIQGNDYFRNFLYADFNSLNDMQEIKKLKSLRYMLGNEEINSIVYHQKWIEILFKNDNEIRLPLKEDT